MRTLNKELFDEEYKCEQCNYVRLIYRKTNKRKKKGHKKSMYCPICKIAKVIFIKIN